MAVERTEHTGRVLVIGAGAAGLMSAIFAAEAGAEIILIERTAEGGKKILISGGGRCNILPVELEPGRFVTDSSPNALRNILRSWPLDEQRGFFEQELQLPLVEERGTRKLFPASQRARDVRDKLLACARRHGVTMLANTRITGVEQCNGWRLHRDGASPLEGDAVIVATGGLSIPATGSDGDGLRFAETLGLQLQPRYPALTPITAPHNTFTALAGIALDVRLLARDRHRSATASGALLFTHRGYSGPAVLDVSHVLSRSLREHDSSAALLAQWSQTPESEWDARLRDGGGSTLGSLLRRELPERLAAVLLQRADLESAQSTSRLRREKRLLLLDQLFRCSLPWSGDEGFAKAEVTGGGIQLSELNTKTLESRKHPGLFFCGEILDVFGPIGGFNFAWAWATGRAAGRAAGMQAALRTY